MTRSRRQAYRNRHIHRCAMRCIRYWATVVPLLRSVYDDDLRACIVISIALIEMGARSSFERWVERLVFRIGVFLTRARVLPGVPDISVGLFQMRPSTAFHWERVQVPFGHLARPPGTTARTDIKRAVDLLDASKAVRLFLAHLSVPEWRGVECSSLPKIYSCYRGSPLSLSDIDRDVLMKVHDIVHSQIGFSRFSDGH